MSGKRRWLLLPNDEQVLAGLVVAAVGVDHEVPGAGVEGGLHLLVVPLDTLAAADVGPDEVLALLDEAPADPCPGPDPYLDDTPGRVVDLLSVTPYVEQDCHDTTWEGWPFEAQRCTYNNGLKVTFADPSAEQVTAWIADASQMIRARFALEERDRNAWKDGLEIIAAATLYQSSRIFPLEGEIDAATPPRRSPRSPTPTVPSSRASTRPASSAPTRCG